MPIVETYKNLEVQLKNAIKAYNKNKNDENHTAAQTLLFRYERAKSEIVFGHLEEKNELIKQFIAELQSRNQSTGGAINAKGEEPTRVFNLGDALKDAGNGSKAAPTEAEKAIIQETAQKVIDQTFGQAVENVAAQSGADAVRSEAKLAAAGDGESINPTERIQAIEKICSSTPPAQIDHDIIIEYNNLIPESHKVPEHMLDLRKKVKEVEESVEKALQNIGSQPAPSEAATGMQNETTELAAGGGDGESKDLTGAPDNVQKNDSDDDSVNSHDGQQESTSKWQSITNGFTSLWSILPTISRSAEPQPAANVLPVMPERYEFWGAGIEDHKAHDLKLQEITLDTLKGVYQARNLRNKMISDLTGVNKIDELTLRGKAVWSIEAKEQLDDFKAEREVREALYNVMIDAAEVTKTKEATDDHSDQNDQEVNQIDNNSETKAKIKPEEIDGVIYEKIDGVIYKDIAEDLFLAVAQSNNEDEIRMKFDNKITGMSVNRKILLPVGYLDQNDQVLVDPKNIDGKTAAKIKLLDEKVAIYDKSFLALQSKKTRVYNGLTRSTLGSIHNPNNEKGRRTGLKFAAAFIALGSAFMSILTFSEIGGTVLIPALALGSLTPPGMIVLGSVVAIIALVALAILVKKGYDYRAEIGTAFQQGLTALSALVVMIGQAAWSGTKVISKGLGHTIANIGLAALSVVKLAGHVVGHIVKAALYVGIALVSRLVYFAAKILDKMPIIGAHEESQKHEVRHNGLVNKTEKNGRNRSDSMDSVDSVTEEDKAKFPDYYNVDVSNTHRKETDFAWFHRVMIKDLGIAMKDDFLNAAAKSWNSLLDSVKDLCDYLKTGFENALGSESKVVELFGYFSDSIQNGKVPKLHVEDEKRLSKQISDKLPEAVKDYTIKNAVKRSQSFLKANPFFPRTQATDNSMEPREMGNGKPNPSLTDDDKAPLLIRGPGNNGKS